MMKATLVLLVVSTVVLGCANGKKDRPVPVAVPVPVAPAEKPEAAPAPGAAKSADATLVTELAWGQISAQSDFAALQGLFGAVNVKDERVCGPECVEYIEVTKIYPGTPQEITVHWQDGAYHKKISVLKSEAEGAPYQTVHGTKSGSTLKSLVALNEKPITFYGFDWDYGGTIASYNGGKLEKSRIHFVLGLSDAFEAKLSGDQELNSDMPVVQKELDKIKVTSISLSF